MNTYIIPSLIERFLVFLEKQGKSRFTIIAYKKDLEQLSGYLSTKEKTDVREIKKEDIDGFINKLISENYAKKSASRKLNSIRTFFRFLKNESIVEYNPSLDVIHPKYSQGAPRIFSKLEYRALRDISKEDPRTYALVEILLQTGIKIGELAGVRVSDMKDNTLFIRKYGKSPERDVPLNAVVKKAITEYLKYREAKIKGANGEGEDCFLFITRTKKPLLVRNIRQIIARCFQEVGIEKATVNDLRNTFIAHQLQNGLSVEYIAKIVGHRRLSSTERFLNLVKEEIDKKEKLGEL